MKKTLLILLLLLFSFGITTYRVSAEIFEEGIIADLDDEEEEDEEDFDEDEEDEDEEDFDEDEENESGEVSNE